MLYYYGKPSEEWIDNYYEELTEMLAHEYVASVEYGFKRNGNRIVSLHYTVSACGTLEDSRAGGVYARADVSGATWSSYMIYSDKWLDLTAEQRRKFKARLPIQRTAGEEPGDEYGYWVTDRSYSYDGIGVQRHTFRPY
jgi:hypothetical protein